jgi:hypothetical protein
VHGVGTVVFTVSAQFGVPVPYIWAPTRGITSYAREIVAALAEVERRPAAFLAQLAPVAESQRSRARDKGSALGQLPTSRYPIELVRFVPESEVMREAQCAIRGVVASAADH